MTFNAKLSPNFFSVNVSVQTVLLRQQIKKNPTILGKIVSFSKFVGDKHLVRKYSQKNN